MSDSGLVRFSQQEEPCPPREALLEYARGGRNPKLAGHISRCDPCAWIVSEAMESEPLPFGGEVIDITPARASWFRRFVAWLLRT